MEKLAIIGTGIAGMSAAYFLKDKYDITVFEKNAYIGGHTNTLFVDEQGEKKAIDTGFMVFNENTYPLLIKLFEKLNVPTYNTDMSFTVQDVNTGLEYSGSNLWSGIFSQKKNLFNLSFLLMLKDVTRFFRMANPVLNDPRYAAMTIQDFAHQEKFGQKFLDHFLIPMSSAVWSTPNDKMLLFPIRSLVRFFVNHGLMGTTTQHQWKTVQGGSENYKQKMIASFRDRIHTGDAVVEVTSENHKIQVTLASGKVQEFDKVVFASHADETLKLIKHPTSLQQELLSVFKYQENVALLHTDEKIMPRLKVNWSSWNFCYEEDQIYTVYYMNRLQKISDTHNYFVNINGESFVDKNKVIQRIVYHHPLFDLHTTQAQTRLSELNFAGPMYFCGSYFRYGFHEDALMSSVALCEQLLNRNVL